MTISWQTAAAMLEHLKWCLTSDQKDVQMYKDPNSSTCVKINIFPLKRPTTPSWASESYSTNTE